MSPRKRSLNFFFVQEQLCPQGEGVDVISRSNLCLFLPLGNNHVLWEKELLLLREHGYSMGSNSSLAPSRTWFKPISPSRT